MARDRYERRHRRTAKNKNAKAVMASADFSGTDLSTAMGLMMTDAVREVMSEETDPTMVIVTRQKEVSE